VLGVLFVPILLLVTVGLLFVPVDWVPRCWLNDGFGIPCPACGSFRAVQLLAHGKVAAAFRQQPFMIVAGLGLVAYSVYAFMVVYGPLAPIRGSKKRWLLPGALLLFVAADWVYVLLWN
jgi:hypothetical protein